MCVCGLTGCVRVWAHGVCVCVITVGVRVGDQGVCACGGEGAPLYPLSDHLTNPHQPHAPATHPCSLHPACPNHTPLQAYTHAPPPHTLAGLHPACPHHTPLLAYAPTLYCSEHESCCLRTPHELLLDTHHTCMVSEPM